VFGATYVQQAWRPALRPNVRLKPDATNGIANPIVRLKADTTVAW